MRRVIPGLVCAALAFLAPGSTLSAQTARLGTIDFPTSGAPAAQPQFVRGVLLLHSFEYRDAAQAFREAQRLDPRSEEHTSELQSPCNLVCRLLLEKKKKKNYHINEQQMRRINNMT